MRAAAATRYFPFLRGLRQEQSSKGAVLDQHLTLARHIQRSLLPGAIPEFPGIEVAAFCQCAGPVGGDFYDVVPLASGSALFVISDAMGTGVLAAMLAASLKARLRTLAEWTESPGELLARTNRLMFEELSSVEMFVTVQLGVLYPSRQSLTVANAGHCPLLVRSNSGEVDYISPEGVPLGVLPDAFFVETMVPFLPGASALFYTDGLTESRNAKGDFFGEERLQRWFGKEVRPTISVGELKEKLVRQLAAFEGGVRRSGRAASVPAPIFSPADDQTFILLASSGRVVVAEPALQTATGSALPLPSVASVMASDNPAE